MTHHSFVQPYQRKADFKPFDPKVFFKVKPWINLREESFGGVLKIDEDIVLLGRDGFRIISSLKGETFRGKDISSRFNLDDSEATQFLSLLFGKGVVESVST